MGLEDLLVGDGRDATDSSRAAIAWSQDAGLPMRIAVATVSGLSIGWPLTSGAAPAAWKPHMIGRCVAGPG